jgi:hypothetical protein
MGIKVFESIFVISNLKLVTLEVYRVFYGL